jgi:hypothetical protein
MDEPNIDQSASMSELKARLFEKDRVEKYLRAEVEELWTHINDLNKLPFLALHLKIVSLLRFFVRKVKQVLLPTKKSKTQNQVLKPVTKVLSADILLVLPTDKIEIGGLVSATKLVKQLGNFGFSIKILSLNHDPTGQIETDSDFISSIPESFKTRLVISSGAETIKFVQDYAKKYGTKSLLLSPSAIDNATAPSILNLVLDLSNFRFPAGSDKIIALLIIHVSAGFPS